jgi:glycerophosphoryl diester phosphodiesterase
MSSIPIPDLIAHRGNAAEYPENTLPAIRSALDLGARYIEFDVQLTADRHPVLLHDSNLKRTAGIDRNALEMTLAELAEVRVNEAARFRNRFTDVGIPTLSQVVSLLETEPEATAFVELKRASLRTFGQEAFVHKVTEVLKPVARQCVIISFDLAAIHYVRQISSFRVGWVLSEYSNLSALKCEALAPDYVFCDHQLLTETASRLWRGPWRWAIYEVTTPRLALDLAARGARLIETMAVRTMLRELRSLRGRAESSS